MEFDRRNSLGAARPEDIAEYLTLIGDNEAAQRFADLGNRNQGISVPFLTVDHWANSGCKVGYIAEGQGGRADVVDAVGMDPDHDLIGARLKLTLDQFYVHNYPGSGQHQILCEFAGKNQAGTQAESLRFALTLRARDQAAAAIAGMPIFTGVTASRDGLSFEGRTVNVRSDTDEKILAALNNASFKDGLSLLATAQPVLLPFTKLAEGVVTSILTRSGNKEVFSFALGLDFSSNSTSAKLKCGSYVIVQTDEVVWDWDAFEWSNGTLKPRGAEGTLPLNFIVLGISRSE